MFGPQNRQNAWLLTWTKEEKKFEFLLIFSFLKIKGDIPPWRAQASKCFLFNWPILGYQSKFSEDRSQVKKQCFKVKFWNWGPLTI